MQYLDFDTGTDEMLNWLVCEKHFHARYLGKCESIFCQGNGYLGLRNALEESYIGETRNMFVAGTFDRGSGENEVTELPNLPDITAMNIYINGFRFNLETGSIHKYKRTLNLKNGETVRYIEWLAPDGSAIQMEFRRFVSLANNHLVAAQISVTPLSGSISFSLESGIDGKVSNHGTQHFNDGQFRLYDGKYLQVLTKTLQSGITVAIHSAHLTNMSNGVNIFPSMSRRTLKNCFSLTLEEGKSFVLEKVSCIHTSSDLVYSGKNININEQLKEDGMNALKKAYVAGYAKLLEQSTAAWKKYWDSSDLSIESENSHDQLGLRFALYHLNIMAQKEDSRVGIGAKGLSGEGYKGHAFWDTDLFIQPYFTLTNPSMAQNLLKYRYRGLDGARQKAIQNGYCGAMYPWECARIDDGEVAPPFLGIDIITGKRVKVLTGTLEHHITADVAYGIWQYYLATGDSDYMEHCGYEIFLETSIFWGSRAEYNAKFDRYEINNVIGPDEYKEHVNNNAYTNYMAHWNMEVGLQIADSLSKKEPQLWEHLNRMTEFSTHQSKIQDVCKKLYLPIPNADSIVPQTDTYLSLKPLTLNEYKEQTEALSITKKLNAEQLNQYMVSKQADLVMLMFLFEDLFDQNVQKKNLQFYEAHTLHDSSLSKCVHSIVANRLGMSRIAYQLFEEALKVDFGPNMKSSDEGIHSASLGGIWQCAVVGFCGLHIKKDGLYINPSLPESWKQIHFSIIWHGSRLTMTASTNKVEITNSGSNPVFLHLFQYYVTVPSGKTVIKKRSLET